MYGSRKLNTFLHFFTKQLLYRHNMQALKEFFFAIKIRMWNNALLGRSFCCGKVKHELRVQTYQLRVQSTSYEFKFTSYEFQSTSYEFKSASYMFKSMSYEFKPTSYMFKFTSCEFKSTS